MLIVRLTYKMVLFWFYWCEVLVIRPQFNDRDHLLCKMCDYFFFFVWKLKIYLKDWITYEINCIFYLYVSNLSKSRVLYGLPTKIVIIWRIQTWNQEMNTLLGINTWTCDSLTVKGLGKWMFSVIILVKVLSCNLKVHTMTITLINKIYPLPQFIFIFL